MPAMTSSLQRMPSLPGTWQSPHLILADIEMPFMNGLEFVQALKSDPSVAHTPVIFVSSRDDLEDLARSFGAIGFLKKPVLADQLLATVARQLNAGIPVRP
jgi:CheY-like chemotaxis protein